MFKLKEELKRMSFVPTNVSRIEGVWRDEKVYVNEDRPDGKGEPTRGLRMTKTKVLVVV